MMELWNYDYHHMSEQHIKMLFQSTIICQSS